ncbi:MAG: permease [Dehalococcoidia bacterium]
MNANKAQKSGIRQRFKWSGPFLLAVLVAYAVLYIVIPGEAASALASCGKILSNMALSLGLVFLLMLALNLFLKPSQVSKWLGEQSGIKGAALAIGTGILSAGPIYAWYPLLAELRDQGAGNVPVTLFIYNRAIKPFLLPVMISYFGWLYVVILMVLMVVGSFPVAYCVSALVRFKAE